MRKDLKEVQGEIINTMGIRKIGTLLPVCVGGGGGMSAKETLKERMQDKSQRMLEPKTEIDCDFKIPCKKLLRRRNQVV